MTTLAENFKNATHEQKIKFLLDVLRDFEDAFSKGNMVGAIEEVRSVYGSLENLEVIFSYIVRDELREQSVMTAKAFIRSFTAYYSQLKEQVRGIPIFGQGLVDRFFPF